MQHILVIQLARFGDIIQTKRLVATLRARHNTTVHLLVDASMVSVAGLLYPDVVVHAIDAHAGAGHTDMSQRFDWTLKTLSALRSIGFERVYNINYSGMSQALSTLFDPDIVRGYALSHGQATKTDWSRLGFRLTANRRTSCLNLVDFWAHFTRQPLPADQVNPIPQSSGGGIGVALAGRNARRSLPPALLARATMTMVHSMGARRIVLLGTAAESASAREFMQHLKPGFLEKATDLTGKTSFADLFEIVSGLDRLLTPDTGLMHLAAHVGTPVTAFFLSSAWCHETGPYGPGHMIWQAVFPCSPCLESRPCPIKTACRTPFEDPTFPRCLAKPQAASLPQGLVGFSTELDALGVRCVPRYGEDDREKEREYVRSFLLRHLELSSPGAVPLSSEQAGTLYSEPMWMLRFDHGRGDTLQFLSPAQ
ncbi:glycosyltransferase family 9 protein [Desulfovibrio inopinatus]|uniref:glycosyltransferase family 9 protein n=1 Tax=Desulfovibrio inopinatus TaxID=102109 RepID=UPI000420800F|nr:glycosyltransferase family 9 protein [Desulfovibrio inopinatus]